jgi:hypothetical protein
MCSLTIALAVHEQASMLYRYVPFKLFEKTCSEGNNNGWSDVYQGV